MLRDYLNVPTREELYGFVLAQGQAIAVLGVSELGDIPQETWYFDENSMAEDNGENVIRPNDILETDPGRYLLNMVQADWDMLFNRPNFATVAMTGSYNDLFDKITPGGGILMSGNEVAVDDTQFMSVSAAESAINTMQADIEGKVSSSRTLTVNGITKDLSANRDWEVGNVSTDGSYSNPGWITSLAFSKITGVPTLFSGAYSDLTGKPTLFSGSYLDLTNKPTIPSVQVNSDWNATTGVTQILNKPVLFSGNYADLNSKPSLFSGAYSDLTGKPSLFSGSYADLTNKPAIPAAQVNSDWNSVTGLARILNKPSLSTVATTGSYNDLIDKPLSPSFTNSAVKTLNGTGIQLSTTRNCIVSYTITHTIALTLVLSVGTSMVYLEISPNNTTWTTISQAGYSDGVAVAVALTKATTNNVQGVIPANYYVRLRAVTSGAGTAVFIAGQEVLI